MATTTPPYTLVENINKTEQCRVDIEHALRIIYALYAGNSMLKHILGIDFNVNSVLNGNIPLTHMAGILNSLVPEDFKKYQCYLYYTYCGYSLNNDSIEPIIGYTSNKKFRERLDGDKWFYNYVTGNLKAYRYKEDFGRCRILYDSGDGTNGPALQNTIGGMYFHEINDLSKKSIINNAARPDFSSGLEYGMTAQSFHPIDTRLVANPTNANIDRTDWLNRFPWYPCKIFYPKGQNTLNAYNGAVIPVKQIAYFRKGNPVNNNTLNNFAQLLVNNKYWEKNYITLPTTDIIVPASIGLGWLNATETFTYKNINSNSSASTDREDAVDFNRYNFSKTNFYCNQRKTIPNEIFTSEIDKNYGRGIPTLLNIKSLYYNNINPTNYSFSFTKVKELGDITDGLLFTPLARRQPCIVIDDYDLFDKDMHYKYSTETYNHATNSKMAFLLNSTNYDYEWADPYISKIVNAASTYNSTTGVAGSISEFVTLNRGIYKVWILGGGGDGGGNKYWKNRNTGVSGAGGGGIVATIEVLKNNQLFKIVAGGPGVIPAGVNAGYYSSKNNGAKSGLYHMANGIPVKIFEATGGIAGYAQGGEGNIAGSEYVHPAVGGRASVGTTYDKSVIKIHSQTLLNAPGGTWIQHYPSAQANSPNSVLYNYTITGADGKTYTIENKNGKGANGAHYGAYSRATGGLVAIVVQL